MFMMMMKYYEWVCILVLVTRHAYCTFSAPYYIPIVVCGLSESTIRTFPQTTDRWIYHTAKTGMQMTFKRASAKILAIRTSQKTWSDSTVNTPNWPRSKAVANYVYVTGCDCLMKHLCHIGLFYHPYCTPYDQREGMDRPHLFRCNAVCSNIWKPKILGGKMSNGCITPSTYQTLEQIITFPHYLINGTIFIINLLNIKSVFSFSLQHLSETFLIMRRTQRDITNVHRSSWKVPVILLRI
jgi:hypothetical protein